MAQRRTEDFALLWVLLGVVAIAWFVVVMFLGIRWIVNETSTSGPPPQTIPATLRYDARHVCDLRDEVDELTWDGQPAIKRTQGFLAEYQALVVFRRAQEQYERKHPGLVAPTLAEAGTGVC